MNLLTQNQKLKETSKQMGIKIFNFSIPAYKSRNGDTICKYAKDCVKYCYAQKGNYKRFPKIGELMEQRYALSLTNNFVALMNMEIKKKKAQAIRIHDSGDFYSKEYLNKWLTIAKQNPKVKFYSYTNSIKFIKELQGIPGNFDFIFSDSGKQVNLIDKTKDRHTKIFDSIESLNKIGYKNASKIDLFATKWYNPTNKVGLIFH